MHDINEIFWLIDALGVKEKPFEIFMEMDDFVYEKERMNTQNNDAVFCDVYKEFKTLTMIVRRNVGIETSMSHFTRNSIQW